MGSFTLFKKKNKLSKLAFSKGIVEIYILYMIFHSSHKLKLLSNFTLVYYTILSIYSFFFYRNQN